MCFQLCSKYGVLFDIAAATAYLTTTEAFPFTVFVVVAAKYNRRGTGNHDDDACSYPRTHWHIGAKSNPYEVALAPTPQ